MCFCFVYFIYIGTGLLFSIHFIFAKKGCRCWIVHKASERVVDVGMSIKHVEKLEGKVVELVPSGQKCHLGYVHGCSLTLFAR